MVKLEEEIENRDSAELRGAGLSIETPLKVVGQAREPEDTFWDMTTNN